MANPARAEPCIFVIFGATGDLTWRKLVPALIDLYLDGWMPDHFAVIGIMRRETDLQDFLDHLRDGVNQFSRRGKGNREAWEAFTRALSLFTISDSGDANRYAELAKRLAEIDGEWGRRANRIFYLAIPPQAFEETICHLGTSQCAPQCDRDRIVIEKPFGRDLASAQALNRLLGEYFKEKQVYRIDHYLGKETVQNILALRFANTIFEPIWNRRYIDHVQMTVAEEVGVEHRGGYYERAGALRDMIQNHLLQLLCLIGMEPPVSFEDEEIRNKKVDVLRAVRPIPQDEVYRYAVRGQYGAGWIRGANYPAYRDESSVDPDSTTDTFAAIKLFIDNWRWQGVPFYLRTGKRLPARVSDVFIGFSVVPHLSFPASVMGDLQPNRLGIRIQPDEALILRIQAKRPGLDMRLSPVEMRFSYREAFKAAPPEAYETLLLEIMQGDTTLFMRGDQTEAAWQVVDPILKSWEAVLPADFPNYPAGIWGPEAAEVLIARDGRSWQQPVAVEAPEEEAEAV